MEIPGHVECVHVLSASRRCVDGKHDVREHEPFGRDFRAFGGRARPQDCTQQALISHSQYLYLYKEVCGCERCVASGM